MTEITQLIEKFGIPYGGMMAIIVVLWGVVRTLYQKNEEMHERLERRGPGPMLGDKLEQLVGGTARTEAAVKRLLAQTRDGKGPATQGTETTKGGEG